MQQVRFLPTLPSLLAAPDTPLIHRDISWLQFNERVLAEAKPDANPLLERAKFIAISASNLDEFFMIRLASLGRSIAAQGRLQAGRAMDTPDEASTYRHLSRIRSNLLETIAEFGAKQVEALELLSQDLETAGVPLVRQARSGETNFQLGQTLFREQVLPHLSPPENFSLLKMGLLENLQLGVIFPRGQFFRVPRSISPLLKKDGRFFFLDDLLASHLGPSLNIEGEPAIIRLTRDGDFSVDLEKEDPESIPDVVRSSLSTRERGRVVRVQYLGPLSEKILQQSLSHFRLAPNQIFPAPGSLCLHGLWSAYSWTSEELVEKHQLKHKPIHPFVPKFLADNIGTFDELKKHDFLLHHPYDGFEGFVGWIQSACDDPHVAAIDLTVYRVDAVSPVVAALKKAAAQKCVRVVIELRARFDELNNLRLAEELRQSGVQVFFGFGRLKLHAKIALVTRHESEGVRYYTHLSTGNYNSATARQYTDLAILTASQEIGHDAKLFFDSVCRGEIPSGFKQLVLAPTQLHRRLLAHIKSETQSAKEGKAARIVAKVNALVDDAVIENLYQASQAGVKVELIVRGACSLVPGVKGLSERIRVISVVDRFLEHSRLYYFENGRALYLSSADWMPRNFFSRLEIAFPIQHPLLYSYLTEVLIPAYLKDSAKARELTPQGTWRKVAPKPKLGPFRSQFFFADLAEKAYKGTPLE